MKYTVFLFYALFVIQKLSVAIQDTVETPDEVTDLSALEKETPSEEQQEEVTNTFSAEWERTMSDYEPAYVYMLPIKPKKSEKFYEDITNVPTRVRGAFLTDENKKDKLEFVILNPLNKVVYKNFTNECIFEFNATIPGTYAIKFSNSQSNKELKATFTLNTYQDTLLQKQHFDFSEEKVNSLVSFMKKIKLEENFVVQKKKERRIRHSKNNRYVFAFCVIETAVLIAVSAFQFYYIKKIIKQ